ncbi:carbamoyltransferase HypF [Photobacterium damselae]|uniref:carbamoyltransferase HypF n=1 Tax=Photobacterium damselae TaxID=38293 RepID=UPI001EFDD795|nr:carbamoyltransferase HypF [Photobacterium damselae]MCG9780647.1 carbamoyltransferase HypF [Photobacterium damselae]
MNFIRKFRINGIVQGVGFRPFVHRLAKQFKLNGWVLNDSEGVLVELQGSSSELAAFRQLLTSNPPKLAKIDSVVELSVDNYDAEYTDFMIVSSEDLCDTKTIVPPDSYVCDDCLHEMSSPDNRRYRYPFINCTNCGPRYSLIEKMPYDRKNTTMRSFIMCSSCLHEYEDIEDRRYHAQPNACADCGPRVWIEEHNGQMIDVDDPVRYTISLLKQGYIIAIKSLGGFHLAVDASNEAAVRLLRERKKRDNKPFALMVRDIEQARRYTQVSEEEQIALEQVQRPIVLLKKIKSTLPLNLAPNNPSLGVMLPSAPLHYLLLEDSELPALVMTSANLSGHPIVYRNDKAKEQLKDICDFLLLNDRDITTRVDDSILRLSKTKCGEIIQTFIRRSRGYAPYPIKVKTDLNPILAIGAELKTTLAMGKEHNVFLSQHIGDLKNDETFNAFLENSVKLAKLLDINPKYYCGDLHPQFRSCRYLDEKNNVEFYRVQHHHAHMASCIAENKLDEKTVIGVIYDGTGYGEDGTIWGGEILIGNYNNSTRVASLSPFQLLGGDKAVKEPIRIAISLLHQAFGSEARKINIPAFDILSEREKCVYFKMAEREVNSTTTSSMGRLFDGFSALMGICPKIEYEAQAAIEMEGMLERDIMLAAPLPYDILDKKEIIQLDIRPTVRAIVPLLSKPQVDTAQLSRRFHSTIAYATRDVCQLLADKYQISDVVLSGGVFMNEYLLCNIYSLLKNCGLRPHVQQLVPSNDGGVSLGQLMVANSKLNQIN